MTSTTPGDPYEDRGAISGCTREVDHEVVEPPVFQVGVLLGYLLHALAGIHARVPPAMMRPPRGHQQCLLGPLLTCQDLLRGCLLALPADAGPHLHIQEGEEATQDLVLDEKGLR